MHTLTIAVPTYNRAKKLDRLLGKLTKLITETGVSSRIELFVSDNASTDGTPEVVTKHMSSSVQLRCNRNTSNLGFDGNVRQCYQLAKSDYVWFFSDDDLPDDDSVTKILEALDRFHPNVLLFSFRQPPSAEKGVFDFPTPVHVENDPKKCTEMITWYPKVSTFVLRKVQFSSSQDEYLASTIGDGFCFMTLALTVLQHEQPSQLLAISESLACSDDEYDKLDWTPEPFLKLFKQADHPFVREFAPELKASLEQFGYLNALGLAYAAKCGRFRVSDPKKYDNFISQLHFNSKALFSSPRDLVRYLLLKLRIAGMFPVRNHRR